MNESSARYLFMIALFGLLCMYGLPIKASQSKKESLVNKEEWVKHTKGIDYTEQYKESAVQQKRNFELPSFDFAGLRILLFIVIVSLLLFLLLRILIVKGILNIKQPKKPRIVRTLSDVEDDIEHADLESLLNDALQSQLYYLAIRLQFLIVLKTMYGIRLIHYKKDKTNGEYLIELKSTTYYQDFKALSNIFERVWYGSYSVTQHDFQLISNQFKGFTEKINRHEK